MGGKFTKNSGNKDKLQETSWDDFKRQSERSQAERQDVESKFSALVNRQQQSTKTNKKTLHKEKNRGSFLDALKQDDDAREVPYRRNKNKMGKTERWEEFHKKNHGHHPTTQR